MVSNRNKVLLATALLFSWGCGIYSFRGNLPSHIKSIVVMPVINQTAEFEVAELATELVLDLLIKENVLRVTNAGDADSDLRITITRVKDSPATYDVGETVQEWRIDISTKVVWYDLTRNRPLFEKTMSGFGFYPPGGDIGSDNIDNDDDGDIDEDDEFGDPRVFAIRTAITKISEDILNEVVAAW